MSLFKLYQFHSKEEIERRANDVLMKMHALDFPPKWPFVADRVVDFLELRILWASIPPDEGGLIAAKIEPLERRITLNEDFLELKRKDRGFEQSTLAHEIGHWILHVNQDEADGLVKQLEFSFDCMANEQLLLCRNVSDKLEKISTKNQDDWREWQAQYFAGCLLMPRYKLEEVRRGRDLTNWNHLYAMRDELGVTISNLVNRLQNLSWIYIPKGSKQIYSGDSPPNGQIRLF